MDSIILTRIKALCEEKDITVTKLELLMGMSQSTIGKWKSATPTVDKLIKVARYFEVSLDYLAGISNVKSPAEALMLDQDLIELQKAREKMSDRDRMRMMGMLRIGFDYAFSENPTEKESVLLDYTEIE